VLVSRNERERGKTMHTTDWIATAAIVLFVTGQILALRFLR
jgi:hypothetical protein